MKRLTLFSLFVVLLAWNTLLAQTTHIANNNPGATTGTNVFTGTTALQDAIDAAISGDIIHVVPSQQNYGDVLIDNKSLTILGFGLNPSNDIGARSLVDDMEIINDGASGSRISGLHVNRILLATDNTTVHTVNNVLVENCEIHVIIGSNPNYESYVSNLIVRNCVFNSSSGTSSPQAINLGDAGATGVIIENNIIRGECCVHGAVEGEGLTIRNNLFYDGLGTGGAFHNELVNSVVRNNIFLNTSPAINSSVATGNTFENNISYNTANDVFTLGADGNTGSGNIENSDPMLTNVPLDPGGDFDWDYSYDLTPLTGSPVLNAGTDGTDIGPTGGANPFNAEGTFLPVIQSLNLPTVVSQGDDLQVNIKAKGNITND